MRIRSLAAAGVVALALACFAALPAGASAVSLDQVGAYDEPVFVTSDPANPDRLFVVERKGDIELTTPAGTSRFLDIGSLVQTGFNEQGLLSMAFAPDYSTSGLFYVFYVQAGTGALRVSELRASGDSADPATLRPVITIPHPSAPNHNGGQIQFGPDGYLYIGTGDGGWGNDPPNNSQNLSVLLGKLLRIDPRGSAPGQYTVPADNPFAAPSGAGRSEVWSYGLRNPYRFSFDRATGDLTIGDVGQNDYEEIDYAAAPAGGRGVNYGWRCREGLHANPNDSVACDLSGATDPVLEYGHTGGACAVTGGYVVRDAGLDELAGRYVYGDYCVGQLRSAVLASPAASDDRPVGLNVPGLSSFGEDACGRIYVASLNGPVSRLVDGTPTECTAFGGQPPLDPNARCAERLDGTAGRDTLKGGSGGQRIVGKGGNDRLKGGSGDDCLDGGGGDDRLTAGSGADKVKGGSGDDRINVADGERDEVTCGKGEDRVRADRRDRLRGCERVRRSKR
ncbi:MAG: PQQ-dependent sugar dehydrogenase [Solirubrobacterales bacterium]|nr:PQQ-dependent sugar dehydrogenase [Solirubrobacterales bacterium]MCB8969742.1 PQQ-dependent sugar dehydrogenase [Thermoleophilales bacterium]MCO5327163.1 PQQ-dependent sugar dehydrogenase [Solirubrobacterales bacterium]